MAETDWTFLNDGLDAATVDRGVTTGIARPPGGGTWAAIPGMAEFIDDALGINSGLQPFTSGRAGFGFFTKDVTRRGFVDHVEAYRQL